MGAVADSQKRVLRLFKMLFCCFGVLVYFYTEINTTSSHVVMINDAMHLFIYYASSRIFLFGLITSLLLNA
jgi:hypothetical protein